jgi:hypothetical protein
VETLQTRLSQPIIRDGLPLFQLLNVYVVLFDVEVAKRVLGVGVEIDVNL